MYAGAKRSTHRTSARWVKLTALWGFTGLSLCGFGAGAVMMNMRPVDAFKLCQRSAIDAIATTIIIVDPSDPLSETQKRRVRTTIEKESERLPKGGRLTILSLNPINEFEPLVEHASVCNPGTAEGESQVFVTRSRVERRWREQYGDVIDVAIGKAIEGPTSVNSPIISSIAALLTRPDFDARVRERRVVLISDLLEHGKSYSQLKGGDFWAQYRSSALARSARIDLRGVTVAIDYLARGPYAAVQGPRHQEFWRRLFSEAGAREMSFIGQQAEAQASEIKSGERITTPSGR